MYKYKAALACALGLVVSACQAGTISTGYSAGNPSIVGLYDINGGLVTSSVNVERVDVVETYDSYISGSTWYYSPISGVWETKLIFTFSNSGWQSNLNAVVGVQACHYILTKSGFGGTTISVASTPVDHFHSPNGGIVNWSSTTGFSTTNDFIDVNPRSFVLNALTVDSSDPTGKTGYVIYSPSTSSGTYPWDDFPAGITLNPSQQSINPVAWIFPRMGHDGFNGLRTPWGSLNMWIG